MFNRPLVFAIIAAMMVPVALLVILALDPYCPSFIACLGIVASRVRQHPAGLLNVAGAMLFFGLIGFAAGRVLRRRQRARRISKHLCPTCGYDLRASKDRCPECGAAIVNKVEG